MAAVHFTLTPSSADDSQLIPEAVPSYSSLSVGGGGGGGCVDDAFEEEDCSICLEPFTIEDPATVTSCKHEYHLQCILDWSQRSKECPICWQLLALKDSASQELLAAVETERRRRLRNAAAAPSINLTHYHQDFDVEQDSYSDDSDIEEHIMQHLAAATSRGRYTRRRERQRSSGVGPSQVLVFSSPGDEHSAHQIYTSSGYNSPTLGLPSVDNFQALSAGVPPGMNEVSGTTVSPVGVFNERYFSGTASPQLLMQTLVGKWVNKSSTPTRRELFLSPSLFFRRQPSEAEKAPGSPEMLSLSDSIKSKWFAASARYKESFSKGTQCIKEKLLARNNSVKELSKGVQREMSAGIAGVTRMIEHLDLTPRRTGPSNPVASFAGGTSNFSFKGKGVQENIIAQTLARKNEEISHVANINATSHDREVEVPPVQRATNELNLGC